MDKLAEYEREQVTRGQNWKSAQKKKESEKKSNNILLVNLEAGGPAKFF